MTTPPQCCTLPHPPPSGTLNWLKKLSWSGLPGFMAAPRKALYPPGAATAARSTGAFLQTHQNLAFFWVLKAGHMVRGGAGGGAEVSRSVCMLLSLQVPADAGEMALAMLEMVLAGK